MASKKKATKRPSSKSRLKKVGLKPVKTLGGLRRGYVE
jgi:hypothetical protein